MCSSWACAARIVATSSSNGLENSRVGPQSGFSLARRLRTARARRRLAAGSSPRAVRAGAGLRARGTAAPLRSPTTGRDAADGTGTVGLEVQPFVAVVDLDEKDGAVG